MKRLLGEQIVEILLCAVMFGCGVLVGILHDATALKEINATIRHQCSPGMNEQKYRDILKDTFDNGGPFYDSNSRHFNPLDARDP